MTRPHTPARGPRLTLLLSGGAALYWLALEDAALWPPLSLGAAFAGLLTLQLALRCLRGPRPGPVRVLGLALAGGLLAGTCAGLFAIGLMLFKNAWHNHSLPDFPAAQLLTILQRTPQMAFGGALSGLGLGMAAVALRRAGRLRAEP